MKMEIEKGVNIGYVQDLKTGAVLSVSGRGCIEEIELQNQELIKKGLEHLITHRVIDIDNLGSIEVGQIEKKVKTKK